MNPFSENMIFVEIVPEQINEFSIKAIASAIAKKCSDERVMS